MKTESDQSILDFDPFEGDFGAPGDRVLTNKMVVARKEGPCAHCALTIKRGERVRRQTGLFDGELMTHRWCALCCQAMAAYYGDGDGGSEDDDDEDTQDPGAMYEARSRIGLAAPAGD